MPLHARIPALVLLASMCCSAMFAPSAAGMQLGVQSDSTVYRTGIDEAGADEYYRMLDDAQADVHRVSLRWALIAASCAGQGTSDRANPDLGGCYDWSMVDDAVARTPRDAAVLFSIREPPCWIHGDPGCVADGSSFVGADEAELARFTGELTSFVRAAAHRYDGSAGRRRVSLWTIWNEPNGPAFWSETRVASIVVPPGGRIPQPSIDLRACHFAHTYATVARAVRDDDRLDHVRLGFGPLAPSSAQQPMRYLDAALRTPVDAAPFQCEGTGPSLLGDVGIDALAFHPYPATGRTAPDAPCESWAAGAPLDDRSLSLQCVPSVRAFLDAATITSPFSLVRDAPWWALELGYEDIADDPGAGVSELTQAVWLASSLEILDRVGVKLVSWYPSVDGGDIGDWQSGLVRADVSSRRVALLAFAAPMSIRPLGADEYEAWMLVRGGSRQLLLATGCGPADIGGDVGGRSLARRARFRPIVGETDTVLAVRRTETAVRARLHIPAGASVCVTAGDVEGRPTAPGIVTGILDGAPFLVAARVIEDSTRDPRGDVIDSRAERPTGNPTLQALVRRAFAGSNEPIGLQANRPTYVAPEDLR